MSDRRSAYTFPLKFDPRVDWGEMTPEAMARSMGLRKESSPHGAAWAEGHRDGLMGLRCNSKRSLSYKRGYAAGKAERAGRRVR